MKSDWSPVVKAKKERDRERERLNIMCTIVVTRDLVSQQLTESLVLNRIE